MKIQRIEILGFGKLHDLNLELAPNLNVFLGENEAGKSTLEQVIVALLYGFYEGDRATKAENERRENYRPWHITSYGGALEYILYDGRAFRVERDFGTDDVTTRAIDLVTGKDVTDSFGVRRHGNVPFARAHLGMSRQVFAATGFIEQGALTQLGEAGTVGDTIVNLADTTKRDVSAVKAVQNLDKLIKSIGTERSRTTQWAVAKRKLSQTEEELRTYREAKASLETATIEREGFSRELNKLNGESQKIRLSIVYKEIEGIEYRLTRIREQDERLNEAKEKKAHLSQYAGFPRELQEEVVKRRVSLQNASERLARLQQSVKQKAEELDRSDLINEYSKLSATVGQLSDPEYNQMQENQNKLRQIGGQITEKRQYLEALEARRIPVKPWHIIFMILLPPIGIPLFFWQRARAKKSLAKEREESREALNTIIAEQSTIATKQETMLGRYEVKTIEELDRKRARHFQIASKLSEYTPLKNQLSDVQLEVEAECKRLLQILETAGISERELDRASDLFDDAYKGKLEYDRDLPP